MIHYAKKNEWKFLGQVLQGQALLSLGLSQTLHSLQFLPQTDLALALERRENLLRLVDPYGLGGFRWIAFQRNNHISSNTNSWNLITRFLEEPID